MLKLDYVRQAAVPGVHRTTAGLLDAADRLVERSEDVVNTPAGATAAPKLFNKWVLNSVACGDLSRDDEGRCKVFSDIQFQKPCGVAGEVERSINRSFRPLPTRQANVSSINHRYHQWLADVHNRRCSALVEMGSCDYASFRITYRETAGIDRPETSPGEWPPTWQRCADQGSLQLPHHRLAHVVRGRPCKRPIADFQAANSSNRCAARRIW